MIYFSLWLISIHITLILNLLFSIKTTASISSHPEVLVSTVSKSKYWPNDYFECPNENWLLDKTADRCSYEAGKPDCLDQLEIKQQEANPIDSHGGWESNDIYKPALPGPCNIPRISAKDLSLRNFINNYAYQRPVVITDASYNAEFQKLTVRNNLIENYGHTSVKLSSANTYSYEKRIISFLEYCDHYLKPQSLKTFANETFYFFGDNNNEEWFDLLDKYVYPLYTLPNHSPQYSFGVAGPGSGVPFHFHGPGFAETMWGRKRWFMYPPSASPNFHPNVTTLQWFLDDYPKYKDDPDLHECTLNPRELIYFPDHWWHATLNIDVTVFMSTFLSPL